MSDDLYRHRSRVLGYLERIPSDLVDDVEFVCDESIMLEMKLERAAAELHKALCELHSLRQSYVQMEAELSSIKLDLSRIVEECEQARRFEQMVGRLDGRLE